MNYYTRDTEKEEKEARDKFNSWIDSLKEDGYTGLVNLTDFLNKFSNLPFASGFYANIIDKRNDLKKVNTNQYKIISNDNKESEYDFEIIEPNDLFYREDEQFKNKKSLVEFLDNSKKFYLNSNMCFIPYTYKQDNHFYLLVINNILENIEDYQLNSLNFLNKQHNIYYIIETNRDDRFNDINALKNYILKTCQRYVNYNKELLYSIYPKINNFKKDKAIVRQYS